MECLTHIGMSTWSWVLGTREKASPRVPRNQGPETLTVLRDYEWLWEQSRQHSHSVIHYERAYNSLRIRLAQFGPSLSSPLCYWPEIYTTNIVKTLYLHLNSYLKLYTYYCSYHHVILMLCTRQHVSSNTVIKHSKDSLFAHKLILEVINILLYLSTCSTYVLYSSTCIL